MDLRLGDSILNTGYVKKFNVIELYSIVILIRKVRIHLDPSGVLHYLITLNLRKQLRLDFCSTI